MGQQPTAKEEEPRRTKVFREWTGCFTQSSRNTLPEDKWWTLINLQPVGAGNVRTIQNQSPSVVGVVTSDTFYWGQYGNIGGVDLIFLFTLSGKVYQFNPATNVMSLIKSGFSGTGSRMAQWKNTIALFVDATGYYSWDGVTFAAIAGAGVPSSGTDIAVAFGRVWIVQGRLLTFSGADDYTAPSFLVANGAGSLALTDPVLRNTVTRLWAQNGYLYVVGNSAINVISDVYVPAGATPPTPRFTNLNIQAIIGSDQPGSFFALDQALLFANRYGAYALFGTNARRISSDIDGTWKNIDFTQPISGGAVISNNIICSAYLIKCANDPTFGNASVMAVYFDGKWWFSQMISINGGAQFTFIVPAVVNNQPALFGISTSGGNAFIRQLFADATSAPPSLASTALWPMEDSLADKHVIRAGFEATVSQLSNGFTLTIDGLNGSNSVPISVSPGGVTWINNSLSPVLWQNNSLLPVAWFAGTVYILINGSAPGEYSKYVGETVASGVLGSDLQGAAYQLSAINMDYKLRGRWN